MGATSLCLSKVSQCEKIFIHIFSHLNIGLKNGEAQIFFNVVYARKIVPDFYYA